MEERWIYGGIRVLNGKRVHAWIGPDGSESCYAHKRAGSWAIGSYYTARVVHEGPSPSLLGTPTYAADGHVPDEHRRQLRAKDIAARARLAARSQEHQAAQRHSIDEALIPLIAAARTLTTSADRDAFVAYVLRRLIASWPQTRRR